MATHEDDLKALVADIELLEAEIASNEEELELMDLPPRSPKRKAYLRIRNVYIGEKLTKLHEKRKDKIEVIAWERRTK
jgi:hypothetical protein